MPTFIEPYKALSSPAYFYAPPKSVNKHVR